MNNLKSTNESWFCHLFSTQIFMDSTHQPWIYPSTRMQLWKMSRFRDQDSRILKDVSCHPGADEPASILGVKGGRSKINLSQSRHNITTERSFCPERGQRWLKLISNCRPKIWLTVSHGQTGKDSLVALRGFLEVVTLQKYDKSGQHNSLHKYKPTRNCTQMTWFWFYI